METSATLPSQVNEATQWHNRYYNRHFFNSGLTANVREDIRNPRDLRESWTGRFNRFTVTDLELITRPGWAGNSVTHTTRWLGMNPAKYLK
jgi:hypothetical protein